MWYVDHRNELVHHHDQVQAEIDLPRLSRMRREMKRRWIHHLDIAKQAVEKEQKRKNQQVLMRFFGRMELLVENKDT